MPTNRAGHRSLPSSNKVVSYSSRAESAAVAAQSTKRIRTGRAPAEATAEAPGAALAEVAPTPPSARTATVDQPAVIATAAERWTTKTYIGKAHTCEEDHYWDGATQKRATRGAYRDMVVHNSQVYGRRCFAERTTSGTAGGSAGGGKSGGKTGGEGVGKAGGKAIGDTRHVLGDSTGTEMGPQNITNNRVSPLAAEDPKQLL